MTKIIRRRRGHVSGRKPVAPETRRPTAPVLRRPLSERCYALLEALRRDGPGEALMSGWENLRREYREAERNSAVDAHSAGLIHYTGWTIRMAAGDPRAAARCMDAYFRNPHLDGDERATRVSYRCLLSLSLLRAGETGDGVALCRLLLASRNRDSARLALATLRGQLYGLCREQDGAETAPAELAELARDLASRLRRKRLAGHIVPGEAPFSLLAEALEPIKDREQTAADGRQG